MGSSGSGSFSDYTNRPRSSSGGGDSGGASGTDKCGLAFSAGLEDVASYQYHTASGSVPPPGTELTIELRGRIVGVAPNGLTVGALPTRYNYLAGCLTSGFRYTGIVNSSSLGVNPQVQADFVAA